MMEILREGAGGVCFRCLNAHAKNRTGIFDTFGLRHMVGFGNLEFESTKVMHSLDDMVRRLPPERRTEVMDFVEFLLTKVSSKSRPKMSCDWAGGLEDMCKEFTLVELQHQASQWRTEDEMPH